jgi:hypothetical protein
MSIAVGELVVCKILARGIKASKARSTWRKWLCLRLGVGARLCGLDSALNLRGWMKGLAPHPGRLQVWTVVIIIRLKVQVPILSYNEVKDLARGCCSGVHSHPRLPEVSIC